MHGLNDYGFPTFGYQTHGLELNKGEGRRGGYGDVGAQRGLVLTFATVKRGEGIKKMVFPRVCRYRVATWGEY